MLERIWGNKYPNTLLVGMETSKPTWKTAWKFFINLKIDLQYKPAIPLLGIYSKEMESPYERVIWNPNS